MSSDGSIGAFRTHSNYLRAFSCLAYSGSGSREKAYSTIYKRISQSGILPNQQIVCRDFEQIKASLENAWGTELLLTMGERIVNDEEVIRLSNNWNVVQAYYVLYHSTQAVAVAKKYSRPQSHPKTQELYYQLFPKSSICLAPWTLAYGYKGPINVASGVNCNDQIHSWTSCSDTTYWSLACKALRTTREDALPVLMRKRRENKRGVKRRLWQEEETKRISRGLKQRKIPRFRLPQLTIAEKEDVRQRLRPYCLIDYLYRLRLRSNYEDTAMFIEGPEEEGPSDLVRSDLCLLAGSTSLLSELYLMALLGKDRIIDLVNNWVKRNLAPGLKSGLAERSKLLNSIS